MFARAALRPGTGFRSRLGPGLLEDWRFGPRAPDVAQRLAHLTKRDVGPRGLDERGHQVVVVSGSGLLQARKRRLDGDRVAPAAQGLDALDLLALEGRVDAQDLDLGLVLQLVAVD